MVTLHELRMLRSIYSYALHEAQVVDDVSSVAMLQDRLDLIDKEIEFYAVES